MRWILYLSCASLVMAQGGTEPKPKAADYESQGQAKTVAVGAEFMIHSFSGQGRTYIAKDYLVVEVALYPPKGETVTVNEGAFALRINGKKLLNAAPPSMVVASLQNPDWQSGPRLEGGGGLGNTGVILGRPVPSQGPGTTQPRSPVPPRAPTPDNPSGMDNEAPIRADELVVQTALPEGPHKGPVAGYLYFPYRSKTSSIKALDLLYGEAVVKLR